MRALFLDDPHHLLVADWVRQRLDRTIQRTDAFGD
jgi:hypothetical protein